MVGIGESTDGGAAWQGQTSEPADPTALLVESLAEADRQTKRLVLERQQEGQRVGDLTQQLAAAQEQIDNLSRRLLATQEQIAYATRQLAAAQEQAAHSTRQLALAQEQVAESTKERVLTQEQALPAAAAPPDASLTKEATAPQSSRAHWHSANRVSLRHGATAVVVTLLALLYVAPNLSNVSLPWVIASSSVQRPSLTPTSSPTQTGSPARGVSTGSIRSVSPIPRSVGTAVEPLHGHMGKPVTRYGESRGSSGAANRREDSVARADSTCRTMQGQLVGQHLSRDASKAELEQYGTYLAKHWLPVIQAGLARLDTLDPPSGQRMAWGRLRLEFHSWLRALQVQVQVAQSSDSGAFWTTTGRTARLVQAVNRYAREAGLHACAMPGE